MISSISNGVSRILAFLMRKTEDDDEVNGFKNPIGFRSSQGLFFSAFSVFAITFVIGLILPHDLRSAVFDALMFNDPGHYAKAHGFLVDLVFSVSATLTGIVAIASFVFGGSPPPVHEHVAGPRLQKGAEAKKSLARLERNLMSHDQIKGLKKGLVIGGIEFSRTREVSHISMSGLPGSGKTVLINSILQQILDRKERAVVHDPKGDFTGDLPSEKVIIFGPWDARSVWWDLSKDITDVNLADSFAYVLVPDAKGGGDSFWNDASRAIISGVLRSLMLKQRMSQQAYNLMLAQGLKPDPVRRWGWDDIAKIFNSGAKAIIEAAFHGNPGISVLIDQKAKDKIEDSKTIQSMMSTLFTKVSWFPTYASAFKMRDEKDNLLDNGFSIRDWLTSEHLENQRPVIVLKNDANYASAATQIFGGFISVFANIVNSSAMPEIGQDSERGIWFILDEYPQLGISLAESIKKIEEVGRSRGLRVVKAAQDISQYAADHGGDKAKAQQAIQQTHIYAKTSSVSAQEISNRAGRRTINQLSLRPGQQGQAAQIEKQRSEVDVLRPSDLTGLRVIKEGSEAKKGVEFIISVDNFYGKVLQPFMPRDPHKKQNPKVMESDLWVNGAFLAIELERQEVNEKEIKELIEQQKNKQARDDAEASVLDPDEVAPVPAVPAPTPAPAPAQAKSVFDPKYKKESRAKNDAILVAALNSVKPDSVILSRSIANAERNRQKGLQVTADSEGVDSEEEVFKSDNPGQMEQKLEPVLTAKRQNKMQQKTRSTKRKLNMEEIQGRDNTGSIQILNVSA